MQIMNLFVKQFLLVHPPHTSFFFGPNIHLSALFSNTFIVCVFFYVTDQFSHPYENRDKFLVLQTPTNWSGNNINISVIRQVER
jgi:hypothetical protein